MLRGSDFGRTRGSRQASAGQSHEKNQLGSSIFVIETTAEAGYIDCIIAAMTKYPETQGVQAGIGLILLASRTAPASNAIR